MFLGECQGWIVTCKIQAGMLSEASATCNKGSTLKMESKVHTGLNVDLITNILSEDILGNVVK